MTPWATSPARSQSAAAAAAEQRLGSIPASHLASSSSSLRGSIAQAAGATDEAIDHFVAGARRAQADGVPSLAAFFLSSAAISVSYQDPAAAQRHASEALALAREVGAPMAIVYSLFALAQALVTTDPDRAHALLAEGFQLATDLGYENPGELQLALFCTARLQDWPNTLRVAGRALHHHARSGVFPLYLLAALLNVVARGLAEQQPEAAAILQGTVGGILGRLAPAMAAPISGSTSSPNDVAAFVLDVRRATTQLLTAALGQPRLRELRAQGAAMDVEEACTYARTRIDEHLATSVDELQ